MGLSEKSKPVSAPGYKVTGNWMDGDELPPERRRALRSASMSLAYLATDRREPQCPSKEAAMMQKTTLIGEQMLRAARLLVGVPRLVVSYVRQHPRKVIDMCTDSNHAGRTQARRGSTGTCVMIGKHWIKPTSSTQTVIGLSSGGNEFYALVKGTSSGRGLQVMARDVGAEFNLRVNVDATAGKGIASRRRLGTIRHLPPPAYGCRRFTTRGVRNYGGCQDRRTRATSVRRSWPRRWS